MEPDLEPITDINRYLDLWAAAIRLYMSDCQRALNGAREKAALDALADFNGTREQLAHLCLPLGLDLDYMTNAILDIVTG